MCFSRYCKVLVTLLALAYSLNPAGSLAKQGPPTIVRERIEGIMPLPNFNGQIIEGILPVSFPWTLERGRAQVNLGSCARSALYSCCELRRSCRAHPNSPDSGSPTVRPSAFRGSIPKSPLPVRMAPTEVSEPV